jgi:hypothetical protein
MQRRTIASVVATVVVGLSSLLVVAGAQAAKPVLEPMYANDSVVFMSAPAAADVGAKNTAQDFYLIAYPVVPAGVHPLCNPCAVPPGIPPVHDVVLEGAPGFGSDGTAGDFNPSWHVLALAYSPQWLMDPAFQPARSAAEVDAGEAAGHFLPIAGPSSDNPFELDTGITFLCVLVSRHA